MEQDARGSTAIPAVRAFTRPAVLLLLCLPVLGGCAGVGSAITSLTTAGVGATVADATGSAVIGVAAGAAAGFGLDQGIKYVNRRVHENVQDAISLAAAPLKPGQSAGWKVIDMLPLSEREGRVEVVRTFGTSISCKEVVFTVDEGEGPTGFYVGDICQGKGGGWKWAVSEPSVHRWGSLQ